MFAQWVRPDRQEKALLHDRSPAGAFPSIDCLGVAPRWKQSLIWNWLQSATESTWKDYRNWNTVNIFHYGKCHKWHSQQLLGLPQLGNFICAEQIQGIGSHINWVLKVWDFFIETNAVQIYVWIEDLMTSIANFVILLLDLVNFWPFSDWWLFRQWQNNWHYFCNFQVQKVASKVTFRNVIYYLKATEKWPMVSRIWPSNGATVVCTHGGHALC